MQVKKQNRHAELSPAVDEVTSLADMHLLGDLASQEHGDSEKNSE